MVTRRSAKNKGAQFEYDCQHNLQRITQKPVYLTKERGFQKQYDIESDEYVVECKKHRSISWNQAKKWYNKLKSVAPEGKDTMLIFQSNRQPVLLMGEDPLNGIRVIEFEDCFCVKWEKHPSTRVKK